MNAMAPNAPIGARRMIIATTPNNACENWSMNVTSGRPRSPKCSSARPNNTETSNT